MTILYMPQSVLYPQVLLYRIYVVPVAEAAHWGHCDRGAGEEYLCEAALCQPRQDLRQGDPSLLDSDTREGARQLHHWPSGDTW